MEEQNLIITLLLAIFASTGFWQFIITVWQNKKDKKSVNDRLLLGLAYRSICTLCEKYIAKGSITKDEYEDLVKYLYTPYKERGGNGTCERLMEEVKKLPIVNQ